MTRIWLVNWHFQSRKTLWCRHKSTNVSMGLCLQMPKFIVWRLWSIYFDHHLPLKPSIGKRRKQSCTPNTNFVILNIAAQYYANTFQSNHFARLTLVDATIKWRIMLNLCTSHCIGAPSVSQIVISYLYTWYSFNERFFNTD